MFWIGLLVGIIGGFAGLFGIGYWYVTKSVGVTFNEWVDVVCAMDGVGNNRDSEIVVITNKGTEFEDVESVKLNKE
jgi:hypothetical protein